MKTKLWTVLVALSGLTMMGLQGCLYSSPIPQYGYSGGPGYYSGPSYYGSPGYYSGYQGPAYRSYGGSTLGSCNPRNGVCMVCDSEGHHCHPVAVR
jgi:hypothetical protein